MAYVVTAFWTAQEGKEETVAGALAQLMAASRAEAGCTIYQVHRSLEKPRLFFIYEQYVDKAAFDAHVASPHFEQHGKGVAIPLLESRERAFYETMDGA